MFSDILDRLARRDASPERSRAQYFANDPIAKAGLLGVTEILAEHNPADFETTPDAAFDCINVVRWIEDDEYWRAGYKSLDAFYAAHEDRHPDIRVYAAVRRDLTIAADPDELPEGIGRDIARRIAVRTVEFPALSTFLVNCFHEDWEHDSDDDDAAIRSFLEVAFPEQVEEVRAELDAFLALGLSEAELEPVLQWNLNCSYDPACDGLKRADWLHCVRTRLG